MTISYQVRCPSEPYENSSTFDMGEAIDLAINLSEDYQTYTYVAYYNEKGHMQLVADYTNGVA